MEQKEKTAFLLLAFGGADSLENVEPFVRNVLKGRPVSPELIEKARDRYSLIGGRSPLLDITKAQAKAIEGLLKKEGVDYKPYIGMRYWNPFIKDTLAQMKADGVEKAITVVMAPFYSRVALSGYVDDIEAAQRELGKVPAIEYAREWHQRPLFIEAVVDNIKKELSFFQDKKDALVIFSNHSLPMTALEGDAYEMLIHQSADEIIKRLPVDFKVSYQSKGAGPREWKGPSTEEVIEGAKKMGKKGVVVVPLGFVADHVETLYDIDILFKGIAESRGLVFRRSASLNTSAKLMELLAGIIKRHPERTT